MSSAFNLTAQLNLRGPSNIGNIVSNIRRQLGTINSTVNLTVNPNAVTGVGRLNASLVTLNTTLAQTQTSANAAASAIANFAQAFNTNAVGRTTQQLNAAVNTTNNLSRATSNTSRQIQMAHSEMAEFGRQSYLAIRRFAAFSIVTGGVFALTNAIKGGISAYVDYNQELVKLQQVTGGSAESLKGLEKEITGLSTNLGVSSGELTKISSTLAQAGLSARDTERALKALALSSLAPSFDDMNRTVEGSIALMRQFDISAKDLEASLGSINSVAAKFAVESSDIIAAIQRTGGVFAAASRGVSEGKQALNEFIAVFTSVRATTRESAETIATGLRTIFTRIQRGSTIEALKEFNVNLTDAQGKFVGAYKAIELLSKGLSSIDPRDLKFSQIVEELGGFRQIGKVIPLIQQFGTAQEALAVAQQGQGSLAEDSIKAQLSLANQISKVREEFLALFRDIGGSDSFQLLTKGALGLASGLIKLADGAKGVLPVLGMLLAFKGAQAATQFGLGFVGAMRQGSTGRRRASGGPINRYAAGGPVDVDVALMPGETVVYPDAVSRIGVSRLRQLNHADKNGIAGKRRGGRVSKFSKGGYAEVPGSGRTDSFYTQLPEGSFVIRTDATRSLGGPDGVMDAARNHAFGGDVQKFENGSWREVRAQVRSGRGRPSKTKSTVGQAVEKIESTTYDRKGRFKTDFPFIIRGLNRKGTKQKINEEAILKGYLNQGVNDLSKAIVDKTQGNITIPTGNINIQNKESIYGGLFETALLKISGRSKDKKDNNQAFDFPRGIGSALSPIFSGMPPDISTDVKRTAAANAALKSNIANKIANDMASNRLPKKPVSVGVVSLSPMDSAIVSKISGVEVDRLLKTKLKIKEQKNKKKRNAKRRADRYYDNALENAISMMPYAIGGIVQKFGKGGSATRSVGYIDSDEISGLLKDPIKGPIIDAEMKRLGIKGVAEFKDHLSNLAASRRQSGDLKRLTNIFGVAGSTKSTMAQGGARGQEVDNAKLRKTTRYPILTEADLLKSDQVVDTTSVAGPSQRNALSSADRVIALSSRTKESQEVLKKNRKLRDSTGKNLFGRKAGATKSAPLDSGVGEAYIAASEVSGVDPKKVATLKLEENFKKTRTNQPNVRTPDKTLLFYGNMGPVHAGYPAAISAASKKTGIPTKDSVALLSGDVPIDPFSKDPHDKRSAFMPLKGPDDKPSRMGMAKAVFGATGTNVSAMPSGSGPGSIPSAFKVGDDDYIVPKAKGNVAIVGDEKNPKDLDKYTRAGYAPFVTPRLGGISGTKARDAIMANDTASLKKLLTPEGFDYVQKHMDTLQKRPKLLDSILAKIQANSSSGKGTAGRLSKIQAQLSELPARVTKTTPLEDAEKIGLLRKERDSLSTKLGRFPSKMLSRLEQRRQRFAEGTDKPIKSLSDMGKADLLREAEKLGVFIPMDSRRLLDQRAKGSEEIRAKVIKELEDQRIIRKAEEEKTSTRAKKRKIGVVGLFNSAGDYKPTSEEVVTPDVKGRKKRGEKTTKGFPATLETGVLPERDSKRVRAVIRRSMEQLTLRLGKIIGKSAGSQSVTDKKRIRDIVGKILPDVEGYGLEAGLAAAGAPYNPKKQALDFPKGLGPEISKLVGIDPRAMVDATRDTSTARSKLIQATRYKRDIEQAKKKKATRKALGGSIPSPMDLSRSSKDKRFDPKKLAAFLGAQTPTSNKAIDLAERLKDSSSSAISKPNYEELLKGYAVGGSVKPKTLGQRVQLGPNQKPTHVGSSKVYPGKYQLVEDGRIVADDLNEEQLNRIRKNRKSGRYSGFFKELQEAPTISTWNQENVGTKFIKKAKGGDIPILAQEGEYVINRTSANQIGRHNLDKLNIGGRVGLDNLPKYHTGGIVRYNKGGSVQKLAVGGEIDNALSGMSNKDAIRLRASIQKNSQAFEQLAKLVSGWKVEDVGMAMKRLDRSLEKGVSQADALAQSMVAGTTSAARQPSKARGPNILGGTPDTRNAGTVGRTGDFKQITGLSNSKGQPLKVNGPGDVQATLDRIAPKITARFNRLGFTTEATEKALLVFNTQVRQTGDANQAFRAAVQSGKDSMTMVGRTGVGATVSGMTIEKAATPEKRSTTPEQRLARKKQNRADDRFGMFQGATIGGWAGFAAGGAIGGLAGAPLGGVIGAVGGAVAGSERGNRIRSMQYEAGADKLKARASNLAQGGTSGSALLSVFNKAMSPLVSGAAKVSSGMSKLHLGASQLSSSLNKGGMAVASWSSSIKNAGTFMGGFKKVMSDVGSLTKNSFFGLIKGVDSAAGRLMGLKKVDIGGGKQGWRSAAATMGADGVTRDASGRRARGFGGGGGGRGGRGGGGMGGGMGMYGLSMGIPMAAQMFGTQEAQTETQASNNSFVEQSSNAVGGALAMATMGGPIGIIAGLGTAAAGIATAFVTAENAVNEFGKNKAAKQMEQSSEKISNILTEISNAGAATPAALEQLKTALDSSTSAALTFAEKSGTKKGSFVQDIVGNSNLGALLGSLEGATDNNDAQGAINRSQILDKKGIFAYLASAGDKDTELSNIRDLIPDMANDISKSFAIPADNIKKAFEQRTRSGESSASITSSPEFAKQAEILARSNPEAEKQLQLIQADTRLSEQDKRARRENIIAAYGNAAAMKAIKTTETQMAIEALGKSARNFSFSLKRMFNNMDIAIAASSNSLQSLSEKLELSAASASGNAKVGKSSEIQSMIDVLKNPRGYSDSQRSTAMKGASSVFGAQSGNMEKMLNLGANIEDTLMSTINSTLQANGGANNEEIGAKVESAVKDKLKSLNFPPDLANKLTGQVQAAVSKMRTRGDEKLDFSQLMEEIPALANSIESLKGASDSAIRALEFIKNSFDQLSDATNQITDIQVQNNSRLRNAQNILVTGTRNLDRALGKDIKLSDTKTDFNNQTRSFTGGATDPSAIRRNIQNLETQRNQQQTGLDQAKASTDMGGVLAFSDGLVKTNSAIRENVAALEQLAQNGDLASAALDQVSKIQAKQAAGVSIVERLVTSTPGELNNLNQAFNRLTNNMQGKANFGTSADQRKESLDVLNMIMPFLGDKQGGVKANILQSQLQESGIQSNPFIDQVLGSLRNPEADPEMKAATDTYREAITTQSEANIQLAKINTDLAGNIARSTADAVAAAIKNTPLNFSQMQTSDEQKGINKVPTMATGGVVYKSVGGNIFQPKGTDTVPAMLTPGEFVVNRSATQRNLPLLKSINSYSSGGAVKYYASGGMVDVRDSGSGASAGKSILSESATATDDVRLTKEEYPVLSENLVKNILTKTDEVSRLYGTPATVYGSYNTDQDFTGPIIAKLDKEAFKAKTDGLGINEIRRYLKTFNTSFDLTPDNWELGASNPIAIGIDREEKKGYLWGTVMEGSNLPTFEKYNTTGVGMSREEELANILLPYQAIQQTNALETHSKKYRISNNTTGGKDFKNYKIEDPDSSFLSKQTQLDLLNTLVTKLAGSTINNDDTLGKKILSAEDKYTGDREYKNGNKQSLDKILERSLFITTKPVKDKYYNAQWTNSKPQGLVTGNGNALTTVQKTTSFMGTDLKGRKQLGAANTDILRPGVLENTAKGTDVESKQKYIKERLKYFEELKNQYENINNFTIINSSKASNNKMNTLLESLYDDNLSGLFVSIPKNQLSSSWGDYGKITDFAYIYRKQFNDKWNRIVDSYKDNKDHVFSSDSNKLNIVKDSTAQSFNWSNKPIDLDRIKDIVSDIEEKNKKRESLFQLDEAVTSHAFEVAIGSEKYEGKFNTQKIKIPKLTEEKGYIPPTDEFLDGFLLSSSKEAPLLNPFLEAKQQLFTSQDPALIAQLLSGSYNTKEPLKLDNIDLVRLLTQEEGIQGGIDPSDISKAYTLIPDPKPEIFLFQQLEDAKNRMMEQRGETTLQPSAKLATSVDRKGKKAKASWLRKSYLDYANEAIKNIILPSIGVFKKFIPNFGLTKLDSSNQFKSYSEGLNKLQKEFGKRITNNKGDFLNDQLGSAWGNVGAVSKFIGALSLSDPSKELGSILGAGEFDLEKVKNVTPLFEKIKSYGQMLKNAGKSKIAAEMILAETNEKGVAADKKIPEAEQKAVDKAIRDTVGTGETATVDNKTGIITYKKLTDKDTPKSIRELGALSLNPYSFFPVQARQSLIDQLLSFFPADNKNKNLDKVKTDITALKNWYLFQDSYLSSKDPTPDDNKYLDDNYNTANTSLQNLTAGFFGLLPSRIKLDEMKKAKESRDQKAPEFQKPQTRANGGLIYASNGTLVNFAPRGTDTVPAMLTPGEFVVNRRATQNNLPLLKSINSGNYSTGGVVVQPKYFDRGGLNIGNAVSAGISSLLGLDSVSSTVLSSFSKSFSRNVKSLSTIKFDFGQKVMGDFVSSLNSLTKQLSSIDIPPTINISATHEVNINLKEGASILQSIEQTIASSVVAEVGRQIDELRKVITKNNDGAVELGSPSKPAGKP
jgi:TP901 family phage tail tape measure protein